MSVSSPQSGQAIVARPIAKVPDGKLGDDALEVGCHHWRFSSLHLIGDAWHLLRLQARPEAPLNMDRISFSRLKSDSVGDKNMTKSSAYSDALLGKFLMPRFWKRAHLSAFRIMALRTSMTKTNNIVERGSP